MNVQKNHTSTDFSLKDARLPRKLWSEPTSIAQEMKPPEIISVKELLQTQKLLIPEYQRPYKWTLKNVNQLIDDILFHKNKSAYRLGTLVLHEENDYLNIVDGQQRTITILLIVHALQTELSEETKEELKKQQIQIPETNLFKRLKFRSILTKNNIKDNYNEIRRRASEFKVETIIFFLERCQFVKVTLYNISEAFQFFDSQNARGVDLAPHDLLKAFHLREMMDNTIEEQRIATVNNWEELESEELKLLFAEYLFRIRHWSKRFSAREFTKNEVDQFKGISPTVKENFPLTGLYRIAHFFVEGYNQDFHRKIDRSKMEFPFQLDQVIINGMRFFEFVNFYWEMKNQMYEEIKRKGTAENILSKIDSYNGRDRRGDQYVRNLFDCALLYYWDKFGNVEMERAIEKIFVWAYSTRLRLFSVQLASIDNAAIDPPFLFKNIRESNHPREVLNIFIPPLKGSLGRDIPELVQIFKDLNYYNE